MSDIWFTHPRVDFVAGAGGGLIAGWAVQRHNAKAVARIKRILESHCDPTGHIAPEHHHQDLKFEGLVLHITPLAAAATETPTEYHIVATNTVAPDKHPRKTVQLNYDQRTRALAWIRD